MKIGEDGFYEGYEPAWMVKEDGNFGLTRRDRIAQSKLADAQGRAAEVRSRKKEMVVVRVAATE